MARTRSSRRAGRSAAPRQWGAIATIAALVVLVVGGVAYYVTHQHPLVSRDASTRCPITGPVAVHAVLVDNSDPLTDVQAQRLSQRINAIVNEASVDTRIDLYLLTAGGGAVAKPEVSLCRPPADGDRSGS